MKKLFTFIVGAIVGLGAYAQDFESGDLTYTVLSPDDKTCAVTGYSYLGSVLEIPESVSFDGEEYTVTEIGEYAFRYIRVNSISFPSTLEVIRYEAFFNSSGYNELVIPNSLKEIGSNSFAYCWDLSRVELGVSLRNIGSGAFSEDALNVIIVSGDQPAQIENGYTNAITSNPLVAVSEDLVAKYQAAWEGANVVLDIPAESLTFDPDSYTVKPGDSIQLNCVTYPENAPIRFTSNDTSVITVDNNGLATADYLRGDYGVWVTATSINGLTADCFIRTESLESFEVDGMNYTVIPNTENEVAVINYSGSAAIVEIPANVEYDGRNYTVTTIGSRAFTSKSDIEEVVIPSSVELIREENFNYCSSLSKITIADSNTTLELSNYIFTDDNNLLEIYVGRNLNCTGTCFRWDDKLGHLVLGPDVTYLQESVFEGINPSLIESQNPEPPIVGYRVFGWNEPTIIVPSESIEAYKLAWEEYAAYITSAVNAENLSFETEEITIYNGQHIKLPLKVEPEGATVVWNSSDPNLISVDKEGNISYYWWMSNVGEAVITASTINGLTAECKVIAKHWLTFSEDNVTMTPGSEYQVEVTKPEELAESPIIWSTTNDEVVTVDENGLIRAIGCGYAEIVAMVTVPGWEDPFSYSIYIEVLNEPTEITALESVISVWENGSAPIDLIIEPQDDSYINREITWTVADPEIAEVVNNYGTNYSVQGLKCGSTTITGTTVNGLSVEIEVKVKVMVEDIIFPKEKIYLLSGQSCKLEFTTVPEETNQTFRYTSENEDIVTVDEEGIITAHNLGTTEILVWYDNPWGGSSYRWQIVQVVEMPESVKMLTTEYIGEVDHYTGLDIEYTPNNSDVYKEIEWTIDNPEIGEIQYYEWIDQYVFVGRNFGTTTFRGVAFNGDELEGTITIGGLKILINGEEPSWVTLSEGDEIKLEVVASSEELLQNFSYTVSNDAVVTVSQDGIVTAVGPGDATVWAEGWGQITENESLYCSASLSITVKPREGIALDKKEVFLRSGNTAYVYIIRPEGAEVSEVHWYCSDGNVADFVAADDNYAELRYVGPGTATLMAFDENGNQASCEFYCYDFKLNADSVIIPLNVPFQLEAEVLPATAESEPIYWWSENEEIVSVDENGMLTSHDITGETRIVAFTSIYGQYVEAYCNVTVNNPVREITLNETTISAVEGTEVQLIATIVPDDATNPELRWESSDESVATVDQDGLVTIHSKGYAVITVSVIEGSEASATCEIMATSRIDGIISDDVPFDIYNMNGILIKKDATSADFKQLVPDFYLIKKGEVVVKIKR